MQVAFARVRYEMQSLKKHALKRTDIIQQVYWMKECPVYNKYTQFQNISLAGMSFGNSVIV